MSKVLKGEGFINRYRITGQIKTKSPLHIGTGVASDEYFSEAQRKKYLEKIGRVPEVATIVRDHRGKPLIPGSTLRGVMRHWLLHILGGFSLAWADTRDYEEGWQELEQNEVIRQVKEEFSWLELLFGTPLHAGKLEVWDANCVTPSLAMPDELLSWNPKSLTYVDTSVAIDPMRGTALNRRLYKIEVVPPGVEFEVSVVGQNLSEEELGMVFLALQGFNSEIYPICIGGRVGSGYGRVQFIPGSVYRLDRQSLPMWLANTVAHYDANGESADAGYYGLPKLEDKQQDEFIQRIQAKMKEYLDVSHV